MRIWRVGIVGGALLTVGAVITAAGPAWADGALIVAQGSDRLPGGVERYPAPGASAPAIQAVPSPVPAPPVPPAPATAASPPQSAPKLPPPGTPPSKRDQQKKIDDKPDKSKKSSSPRSLRGKSVVPDAAPKGLNGGATGGDDRRPGGVEHAPD